MYVCPNGLINILLRSILKGIHPVGISRTHIYTPPSHAKMHMLLHTWSNICHLNLSRNLKGQQIQREHDEEDGRKHRLGQVVSIRKT